MSSGRSTAFRIDMDVNEFEKHPDMNLYNYLGFSQAFQNSLIQWMENTIITDIVKYGKDNSYERLMQYRSDYFGSKRFFFPYDMDSINEVVESQPPNRLSIVLPTQKMPSYHFADDDRIKDLVRQIQDLEKPYSEPKSDRTIRMLKKKIVDLHQLVNQKFENFYEATRRETVIGKSLMRVYNMSQISSYHSMYDVPDEQRAEKFRQSIVDEITARTISSPTHNPQTDFYDMFSWLIEFLETVVIDSHYELKTRLEGQYIDDRYFDQREFSDYTAIGPDMDDYLDEDGELDEEAYDEAYDDFEWGEYKGDFPKTWAALTIDNFQWQFRNPPPATNPDIIDEFTILPHDVMEFLGAEFFILRYASEKPLAEIGKEEEDKSYKERKEVLHIYDLTDNNLDNPDDETELLVRTYDTPQNATVSTIDFNPEGKGAFFCQSEYDKSWLNFDVYLEFKIPGIALINYTLKMPRIMDKSGTN